MDKYEDLFCKLLNTITEKIEEMERIREEALLEFYEIKMSRQERSRIMEKIKLTGTNCFR